MTDTYLSASPGRLSSKRLEFQFGAAREGVPHRLTKRNQALFDRLGGHALAWDCRTEERVLYLTFDCGYFRGTTVPTILEILREKSVPAAFFCTLPFLKDADNIVSQILADGHILGNHTATHPDCSALSREELHQELTEVDQYLQARFDYECRYFRFPSGEYSLSAINMIHSFGYRCVFWSIAYEDWDPQKQQEPDAALQTLTAQLHPGGILLLHTNAPTSTVILSSFIEHARAEGYSFRTLNEFPFL